MVRFKKVSMSNFMSFGQKPTEVSLDFMGTKAVMGVNEDIGDKGHSANGAGKSTLYNAIIFALFGKGIDKMKSDEFINLVNGKKLVVELDFEKSGKQYRIRRGRKPNFVELSCDGESVTLDAMKNTDEAIVEVLGFDYDIFMASFFLSPHRQSFMAMSGPEQRRMIEGMLSLDVLSQRAEALKKLRTDVGVDLKILQKEISSAVAGNQNTETMMARLRVKSATFEEHRLEEISELEAEVAAVERIDVMELKNSLEHRDSLKECVGDLDSKISVMNKDICVIEEFLNSHEIRVSNLEELRTNEAQFDYSQKNTVDWANSVISNSDCLDALKDRLSKIEESVEVGLSIERLVSKIDSNSATHKRYSDDLHRYSEELVAHTSGKCHVCGSDYVDHSRTDELSRLSDDLTEKLAMLDEESDVLVSQLTALKARYIAFAPSEEKELRAHITQLEKALTTLDSIPQNPYTPMRLKLEAEVAASSLEYANMMEDVKKKYEILDNLKILVEEKTAELLKAERFLKQYRVDCLEDIELIVGRFDSLCDKLERLRVEKNPFVEELEAAQASLVDVSSLEDSQRELEKKERHIGYLIKLLTDSKSFIRRRILDNYVPYLNKRINEHAFHLGLSHVCEVNSDLSVDLTYMNRPTSYFNMSRGERLRLDMATTVAFRDVMGMLGKGCNLALLDEVLDSALDIGGVHAALGFICTSATAVFLITHREELSSSVEDKLTVTKRNGFSFIS